MILRTPLFPGGEQDEQLQMIFELLGPPSEEDMSYLHQENDREILKRVPRREPKNINDLFKGVSEDGVDLLKKMLTFDPYKRITV
jgi:serine/threonine protein kinase